MDVLKTLALLSDARAVAVARVAAEDRLATADVVSEPSPELRAAIQKAFDVGTVPPGSADEVVVARHALVFLAEADPAAVERYLTAGVTESVLGLIAIVTVGLVLLQTKVKVELKDGKWSVEVDKPAASEDFLKGYVKAMLGLWK
ncbi:MAG: hypothetical protein K2P78_11650 [Gemmataceae bacterium]|nr:hypothetical protein [Gemmataceae bacterium]